MNWAFHFLRYEVLSSWQQVDSPEKWYDCPYTISTNRSHSFAKYWENNYGCWSKITQIGQRYCYIELVLKLRYQLRFSSYKPSANTTIVTTCTDLLRTNSCYNTFLIFLQREACCGEFKECPSSASSHSSGPTVVLLVGLLTSIRVWLSRWQQDVAPS